MTRFLFSGRPLPATRLGSTQVVEAGAPENLGVGGASPASPGGGDDRCLVLHLDVRAGTPASTLGVTLLRFAGEESPVAETTLPDASHFVVGSSDDADVRIAHPDVAPKHAEFWWRNGAYLLGTADGVSVWVNDQLVVEAERPVLPGDVISLGRPENLWLQLRYGSDQDHQSAAFSRQLDFAAAQQAKARLPAPAPLRERRSDGDTATWGRRVGGLWVGMAQMCGGRYHMEDASGACRVHAGDHGLDIVGIYDGHGGDAVSRLARDELPRLLSQALDTPGVSFEEAATRACAMLNDWVGPEGTGIGLSCGSTAVVVCRPQGQSYIDILNIGDSRAVLCQNKKAIRLTWDQKPDDPKMAQGIERRGGFIAPPEVIGLSPPRVNGVLAMSNAVGDFDLGDVLSRVPVVSRAKVEYGDFVIMATDGLWDVVDDETACELVHETLVQLRDDGFGPDVSLSVAACRLRDTAYCAGSEDNISVAVVGFRRHLNAV